MNEIFAIFVVGSIIWVGWDASANRVASGAGHYTALNGAAAWLIGCILLWIIVIPWYLVRRAQVIRKPQTPAAYSDPP